MRGVFMAACLAAGCSVITPPPVTPRHRYTAPAPEGTASVMLVVGVGGGVWIDSGIGLELRGAYQVRDDVEVGAGVAFGKNTEKRNPEHPDERRLDWLAAGRAYATWFPKDTDWTCVTAGLGLGAGSTGLRYYTMDLGWTVGYAADAGGAYLNLIGALSIPTSTGTTFNGEVHLPTRTWSYGASAGGEIFVGDDHHHSFTPELQYLMHSAKKEPHEETAESGASLLVSAGYTYRR